MKRSLKKYLNDDRVGMISILLVVIYGVSILTLSIIIVLVSL